MRHNEIAYKRRGNPLVHCLELKTLLQAYRLKASR